MWLQSRLLFKNLCNKYNLKRNEKAEIYKNIKRILFHKEFQRRLEKDFLHHGSTTLGEHILEDTILTYIKCKNRKDVNLELALKISMMHDLYTIPWQNNGIKIKKITHKHGFTHPIEAAINSMVWFKHEFDNPTKAEILIDGIVHHMYPLPVASFKDFKENYVELNNFDIVKKINDRDKKILIKSINRNRIGNVSFARSKHIEGRIMSKADKKVSIKQLTNMDDYKALLTGTNNALN